MLRLECPPALGLPPRGWTRETGRRALGNPLPPCGAPAPSKCCRNKKQRPLRPGEGRERQREREGGNKASAARARCSSLYLLAAFAPTPAGPRRPPGEQKRPAAHHAATRRAARALLVNAASPRRVLWAHLATHRAVRPAPLRPRPPGGAARRTSLGKSPHLRLARALPAPRFGPPKRGPPSPVAPDMWPSGFALVLPAARTPGHRGLILREYLRS